MVIYVFEKLRIIFSVIIPHFKEPGSNIKIYTWPLLWVYIDTHVLLGVPVWTRVGARARTHRLRTGVWRHLHKLLFIFFFVGFNCIFPLF